MKKEVIAVLNLIRDLQIEEEIRAAFIDRLSGAEVETTPAVKPRRQTSNGYPIYYDNDTGEAVGIIYKNMVFLASASAKKISWYDGLEYCKTIIINGITAQLCPITKQWINEFKGLCFDLREALLGIGADKEALNAATWCEAKDKNDAWKLSFNNGHISRAYIEGNLSYVRPILILRNE